MTRRISPAASLPKATGKGLPDGSGTEKLLDNLPASRVFFN